MATHQKTIIHGLVDTLSKKNMETTIFNLNSLKTYSTKYLEGLNHLLAVSDPLDALFHETAIIVESDADVRFYRYIKEKYFSDKDAIFIPVFGKSRSLLVRNSLRKLMNPTQIKIIYDIDFVLPNKIGGPSELEQNITNYSREVITSYYELKRSLNCSVNWEERRKQIKKKGIFSMNENERKIFNNLSTQLNKIENIFVVPQGELEGWINSNKKSGKMIEWFLEEINNTDNGINLNPAISFIENVLNLNNSYMNEPIGISTNKRKNGPNVYETNHKKPKHKNPILTGLKSSNQNVIQPQYIHQNNLHIYNYTHNHQPYLPNNFINTGHGMTSHYTQQHPPNNKTNTSYHQPYPLNNYTNTGHGMTPYYPQPYPPNNYTNTSYHQPYPPNNYTNTGHGMTPYYPQPYPSYTDFKNTQF